MRFYDRSFPPELHLFMSSGHGIPVLIVGGEQLNPGAGSWCNFQSSAQGRVRWYRAGKGAPPIPLLSPRRGTLSWWNSAGLASGHRQLRLPAVLFGGLGGEGPP